MRTATKILVNTLVVAVALIVAMAGALLADRWLDLGLRRAIGLAFSTSVQNPEPIMYYYDNRAGWLLNPRTQYHRAREGPLLGLAGLEAFDTRLRVNNDGFIDREHYLKTPYYRIAFIGNSWVEAVQQDFGARFAPLTEDYVFDRSEHKKTVEIMNFGLSNAAPAQSYGVLKSFVLKYEPDEVWLFVTVFDLGSNSPIETPPPFGPTFDFTDEKRGELKDIHFGYVDPPAAAQFKRRQEYGRFIDAYSNLAQVTPYFYSAERSDLFDAFWKDMRLTVALIKKSLDAQRIRMRLVYIPTAYEVDALRWKEYERQATKALGRAIAIDPSLGERHFATLAQDLGIEFVSLMPLCREKGAAEMYADHFSRMGHHWVADQLARLIIKTTPDHR